ncbi:MAG: tetratricopeptide repeat protein [Nannocystaceae bacterium]|nr:tetratricopeptide repeat protein [bacterium]
MGDADPNSDDLGEGAEDLLARILSAIESNRPIVFLLGSALTMPSSPGVAGIPGVPGIVQLLEEELRGRGGRAFDEAATRARETKNHAERAKYFAEAYRLGFTAVMRRGGGQDAANRVIRRAVLKGHAPLDDAAVANSDRACEALVDPPASGWLPLRDSVTALGQLLHSDPKRFPRVLTTNFDPLIEVAVMRAGGQIRATVLARDGNFLQHRGSSTHVVYVHGHWCWADTLHTEAQLGGARPVLEAALPHALESALVVVLGYGGWDDVVMRALATVSADESSKLDIVWGFYKGKVPEVVRQLKPAGERFQAYEHVDMHRLLPRLRDRLLAQQGDGPNTQGLPRIQPAWLETPYRELSSQHFPPPGFQLLRAEHRVVGMSGRDDLLDDFTAWCVGSGLRIRLVTASGGVGKSRLLRELCHQRIEEGWTAGLLRKSIDHDELASIVRSGQPLMFAVDYAENWGDALVEFLREVAAYRESSTQIRIVLAARAQAEWWKTLPLQVETLWDLFEGADIVHPIEGIANVEESWTNAVESFSSHRKNTAHTIDTPPRTTLNRWMEEGILTLHTAALLAVDGDRPAPDASVEMLFDTLLRREAERYWKPKAAELVGPSVANVDEVLRTVACVGTLVGPLRSREEARAVLGRTPGLRGLDDACLDALARVFKDLYPGSDHEEFALPRVQPDRVGERLVATQLEREPSIAKVPFATDDLNLAEPALRVLGRAATWHPILVELIKTIAQDQPRILARAWVAVAADEAWAASLAPSIESTFGELELLTPDEADALLNRLPVETVALRGFAASLAARAVESLPVAEVRASAAVEARLEFGRRLGRLGTRLEAVGRRQEALSACEEAVAHFRELARWNPGEFQPDLATAVSNLAVPLFELENPERALAATLEAVTIRRTLAKRHPETFKSELAASLSNLGLLLTRLGRPKEALSPTREAVQLRRAVATPGMPTPDLALSLNALGNVLRLLAPAEDALAPMQESVAYFRELVEQRPDAFTPDLSMSLNTLGACLASSGRPKEALVALDEAAVLCRPLAQQRPDAFAPKLATILGARGSVCKSANMYAEALDAFAEGVRLVSRLSDRLPEISKRLLPALLSDVREVCQAAGLPAPEDLLPLLESLNDRSSS